MQQSRTEKPRRGNPQKVMPGIKISQKKISFYSLNYRLGAPRGSGVKGMISDFAAMRVGSSSGRSSSRSIPYSNMSETQSQTTEKRGNIDYYEYV